MFFFDFAMPGHSLFYRMSRQIKPWSGIGASQEQTASKTEIRNPWVCLESLTSSQNCAQRSKIWKLRSHRFTGMCGGAGEGGEKSWAMTEGCHWIWFVVTSVTTTRWHDQEQPRKGAIIFSNINEEMECEEWECGPIWCPVEAGARDE